MLAHLFPGQGSQQKGMGKDLFEAFKAETAQASDLLGYSIEDLCLQDPHNQLQNTQYTQPALYLVSAFSYLKEIDRINANPDFVCGHSLGEYAALFAAGVFDLMTGLKMVKKRGELMAAIKEGGMMAVIGPEAFDIAQILQQAGITELDIANYNSPQQIVLSGMMHDVSTAKLILESKNFRCIALNVSGAFHSRYMENARLEFMRFLSRFSFNKPKISVISSSQGAPLEENYILENLGYQLTNPVRWVQSIRTLESLGMTSYVEIGPGEVLTNLCKKIINLDKG